MSPTTSSSGDFPPRGGVRCPEWGPSDTAVPRRHCRPPPGPHGLDAQQTWAWCFDFDLSLARPVPRPHQQAARAPFPAGSSGGPLPPAAAEGRAGQRSAKAHPSGSRAMSGGLSGNHRQAPLCPSAQHRQRRQQSARVGMGRSLEQALGGRPSRRCNRRTSPRPGRPGSTLRLRSWLIQIIAMSRVARSSETRSRICAWMVASRAVVGSSAMRRPGSQDSAMAIVTRWHMPPENWCG